MLLFKAAVTICFFSYVCKCDKVNVTDTSVVEKVTQNINSTATPKYEATATPKYEATATPLTGSTATRKQEELVDCHDVFKTIAPTEVTATPNTTEATATPDTDEVTGTPDTDEATGTPDTDEATATFNSTATPEPEEPFNCHDLYKYDATTSGELTSPFYENGYYPKNVWCEYLIYAPVGYRIKLTFKDLDITSNGAQCNKDDLVVYGKGKKSVVAVVCSRSIVNPILSNEGENEVIILFRSGNGTVEGRRFRLRYESFYDPFVENANVTDILEGELFTFETTGPLKEEKSFTFGTANTPRERNPFTNETTGISTEENFFTNETTDTPKEDEESFTFGHTDTPIEEVSFTFETNDTSKKESFTFETNDTSKEEEEVSFTFETNDTSKEDSFTFGTNDTSKEEESFTFETNDTSKEEESFTFETNDTTKEGESFTFEFNDTSKEEESFTFRTNDTSKEGELFTFETIDTPKEEEPFIFNTTDTSKPTATPTPEEPFNCHDLYQYDASTIGEITSPFYYDGFYPKNVWCEYQINAPVDHRIKLTFKDLNITQNAELCERNDLVVYGKGKKSLIAVVCSQGIVDPILSNEGENEVRILFRSGNSTEGGRGFRLQYESFYDPYVEKENITGTLKEEDPFTFETTDTMKEEIPFTNETTDTPAEESTFTFETTDTMKEEMPFTHETTDTYKEEKPFTYETTDTYKEEEPFTYETTYTSKSPSTMETEEPFNCHDLYKYDATTIGEITSPFYYEGYYPKNVWCEYQITAPVDYRIKLTFKDLDITPYGEQCRKDYFVVYGKGKKSVVAVVCSLSIDDPILSNEGENEVIILFRSGNGTVGGRGFRLQYESFYDPYVEKENVTGTLKEEEPITFETTDTMKEEIPFTNETTHTPAEESTFTFETTDTMKEEMNFTYETTDTPAEESAFTFETTYTMKEETPFTNETTDTPAEESTFTFETTYTMKEETPFTHETTDTYKEEKPFTYETTDTSKSPSTLETEEPFNCHDLYKYDATTIGEITSPFYYDGYYPKNVWCEYQITAPVDYRIKLTFKDLDITPYGEQCIKDYFVVYGKGKKSVVAVVCSLSIDDPILSNEGENEVIILFRSGNGTVGGRGFRLQYESFYDPYIGKVNVTDTLKEEKPFTFETIGTREDEMPSTSATTGTPRVDKPFTFEPTNTPEEENLFTFETANTLTEENPFTSENTDTPIKEKPFTFETTGTTEEESSFTFETTVISKEENIFTFETGTPKEEEPFTLETTGTSKEEESFTLETTGTSKEEEPITLQTTGTSKEEEPFTLETIGASKEEEPFTFETTATSKEEDPFTFETTGTSKPTSTPKPEKPFDCHELYQYDASTIGEVTSPFYYNGSYPKNVWCEYQINAPVDYRIMLTFKDLDIEADGDSCNKDQIIVFSKDRKHAIKVVCGRKIVDPILSNEGENEIRLLFRTGDSKEGGRGFRIQYESFFAPFVPTQKPTRRPKTEEPFNCHDLYQHDATNLGEITSPFYGNRSSYHENLWCEWQINAPEGHRIKLTFKDLDIEPGSHCGRDQLTVYGKEKKTTIATICGRNNPDHPVLSNEGENEIRLLFRSDYLVGGRGFRLQYESAPHYDWCPENMTECRNLNCFNNETRCDGVDDCGDGTDEEKCDGPPALLFTNCGLTPIKPKLLHEEGSDRVVGGEDAIPNSWPWQVSFQYDYVKPNAHFCGGTLITPQWVVSAAHCFKGTLNPGGIRVQLGMHHKFSKTQYEVHRYAEKIISFPDLEGAKLKEYTSLHDISLVKLNAPVQYSDGIQPACIPRSDWEEQPGMICYSTGWGETRGSGYSDQLKQAVQELVSESRCHQEKSQVCVRGKSVSTCHGDSGGPLVCKLGTRWFVIGATSHGRDSNFMSGICHGDFATIFSKVPDHADWIQKIINDYT